MKSAKRNDAWNADLYDGKHGFVSQYGNSLIDLLAPVKGEVILDLGCGTGDITKSLSDKGTIVTGIDQSENMIIQAKSKYPSIPFEVGDALELPYTEVFDAVFSNAVLHWVTSPLPALKGIYHCLKPGGRFVAEFGGSGNVGAITNSIMDQLSKRGLDYNSPWYFPTIGEYTSLMEETGFHVALAVHFERPTPLQGEDGLKNWLKMFAGSIWKDLDEDTVKKVIIDVENQLRDKLYHNGGWVADYKRLRVIGIKE